MLRNLLHIVISVVRQPVRTGILCVLTSAIIACARGAGPSATAPPQAALDAEAAAWVERTLAGLDLRHKIGQLIFPRVSGAYMPVGSAEYERVRRWIQELGIGGLIETLGPPLEAAVKLNMLQNLAEIPLLMTADMEDGPGQLLNGGAVFPWGLRNGGGTRFPPAMGIGATGDESIAREMGRITAREARAIGVHMNFAPVVDVNNNPDNPIINTRSYGADPRDVARLAAAAMQGMQQNGLLATAKHFPGHGDTETDSHIELPVITVNAARADSIELLPYRALVSAGVTGIMSAHIAFPAIAGDSVPATLNRDLLGSLLRDRLDFQNLIVTDALDMGAIVRDYGATEAPILALAAGADMLLQPFPQDVPGVIDAIEGAVRTGRLTEARIDDSVRRILAAKARLGLHRERNVDIAAIPGIVGSPEHTAVAERAADRSITLIRNRDPVLPLRNRRIAAVIYRDETDPLAGHTFLAGLETHNDLVSTTWLNAELHLATLAAAEDSSKSADVIVFGLFIRVGASRGNLALPEPVANLIETVSRARPVIVVSLGNPYLTDQLPGAGTIVLAWGPFDGQQAAAARAVQGVADITGILPIPIPPLYDIGQGIVVRTDSTWRSGVDPPVSIGRRERVSLEHVQPADAGMERELGTRIDSIVNEALADSVASGVSVVVGRHGRIVHSGAYGRTDWPAGSAAVTDSTLWDMASLTKVIATTTLTMMLVAEGRLALDAPLSRYLSEFGSTLERRQVTIGHLLRHDSGLPAWAPLWQTARGREAYLEQIVATPLEAQPGEHFVYSDLGIILLGLAIERITGEPLDILARDRIFAPLGMLDTRFNPLADNAARAEQVAVTEIDTVFRMRHVHGQVHDENAFALGGVAAHAGLFSSAHDLATFAQLLMGGGEVNGVRLLDEVVVRQFTRQQSEASSRGLGWDTPSERSSAGDWFSSSSFGHTGFTGTSLWVDPERDIFLIILTNRVNPTRENNRHVALRRDLADVVVQAISDQPVSPRDEPSR
jgi:beta-glucosidase-like glycosyl hydrolase/CubicO group peptidase (beta-lactamase class C family)